MPTAITFTIRIELDQTDDISNMDKDINSMVETLEDIFSSFEDRREVSFNIERVD